MTLWYNHRVEKRNTSMPVKRQNYTIPENYLLLRILSIILAFAVLEVNFVNVWSLNIVFLLIILAIYSGFIFYPRDTRHTKMNIVRFALGVLSLFVGASLLVYVAKSIVIRDFPLNVSILISMYALFWVVVGWLLVVKSRYTNISSRFVRK